MAQQADFDLNKSFSNLTVSSGDSLVCFEKAGPNYCKKYTPSGRLTPKCNFKYKTVDAREANIWANGKKINLKATGSYSDIEICLMHGQTADGKFRSHWGIICQQEGGWKMNGSGRKCLLFHHMGDGIEILVACINCCRRAVRSAYGCAVSKPNLVCFNFGRSSAAVYRFLDESTLGRNVSYEYNSKYRLGEAYYEWRSTNCCRLVFDLLFCLKLEREVAVRFTKEYTGNEHWDEVYKTITEKYPEFTSCIFGFWIRIKSNKDLRKIETLLDGQYKLNAALQNVISNLGCCIL